MKVAGTGVREGVLVRVGRGVEVEVGVKVQVLDGVGVSEGVKEVVGDGLRVAVAVRVLVGRLTRVGDGEGVAVEPRDNASAEHESEARTNAMRVVSNQVRFNLTNAPTSCKISGVSCILLYL